MTALPTVSGPAGATWLEPHGLWLLPERAVWVPRLAALVVTDLHLGKASALQRHGIALPEEHGVDDIERLRALLTALPVQRLIVLGDLVHAAPRAGARYLTALCTLVEARYRANPGFQALLIPGNHDRHLPELPRIEVRATHSHFEGLLLCHEPPCRAGKPAALTLAGHVHPGVELKDRVDRLRLPAFWLQAGVLVLPAFGQLTGLRTLDAGELAADDRLWAVLPDRVVPLPPALTRRSRHAAGVKDTPSQARHGCLARKLRP